MHGVVTDVHDADVRICRQLLYQRTVMRRNREVANQAALPERARGIQNALRRLVVPKAQQQHVRIVVSEFPERGFDARSKQRGHSRVRLQHQHHALALRPQVAQRLSERGLAETAPVEIVNAAFESSLHRVRRHAVAGGHSDAARFQARPAEDSAFHSDLPWDLVKLCVQ